jgi:hypothetical protein
VRPARDGVRRLWPHPRSAQVLSIVWTAYDGPRGADGMGGPLSRSRRTSLRLTPAVPPELADRLSWPTKPELARRRTDWHQRRIGAEPLLCHVGEGDDIMRWP